MFQPVMQVAGAPTVLTPATAATAMGAAAQRQGSASVKLATRAAAAKRVSAASGLPSAPLSRAKCYRSVFQGKGIRQAVQEASAFSL